MPLQRITTTESLKSNQGQMCSGCKNRSPLCRWFDGKWLCPACDPREKLVELVPDDTPVDRGRG